MQSETTEAQNEIEWDNNVICYVVVRRNYVKH